MDGDVSTCKVLLAHLLTFRTLDLLFGLTKWKLLLDDVLALMTCILVESHDYDPQSPPAREQASPLSTSTA